MSILRFLKIMLHWKLLVIIWFELGFELFIVDVLFRADEKPLFLILSEWKLIVENSILRSLLNLSVSLVRSLLE